MTLEVVVRLILIEVVEEPGQGPELFVLTEVAAQPAHDAFNGDQMTDGRVLLGLLTDQRVRSRAFHRCW